jgi:hypothetical protein
MISYSVDDDSNITEEHTASICRVTSEDTENMFLQNTSTDLPTSQLIAILRMTAVRTSNITQAK